MDIVKTAQDQSTVPSEAAGYSVADYRALQTAAGKQPCVSQSQLLVGVQTAEKDDKGMWYNQVNIISLQSAWLRNAGSE